MQRRWMRALSRHCCPSQQPACCAAPSSPRPLIAPPTSASTLLRHRSSVGPPHQPSSVGFAASGRPGPPNWRPTSCNTCPGKSVDFAVLLGIFFLCACLLVFVLSFLMEGSLEAWRAALQVTEVVVHLTTAGPTCVLREFAWTAGLCVAGTDSAVVA